ncbi:MAG: C10 family peptidase [Bacteroidetes bacterium]|nr:C10 family peptidase [Bacteroidota bacterium]
MKKGLLLLFTGLFSMVTLFAGSVTRQQAETLAINFWRSNVLMKSVASGFPPEVGDITPVEYDEQVIYFQINMKPDGWIMVSATDAAQPILAYSPIGQIDSQNIPANTAAWLSQYQKAVSEIIQNDLPGTSDILQKWEELLSIDPASLLRSTWSRGVEPLLTTNWDQGRYYNEMCPADPAGPGGHCYVGCVPTTLGQLCNYFRWPETGIGEYSYDDPVYGTLSADFGNTTYHWDEMAVSLHNSNLPVAELLYHLGVACDLVYGPDGSGMYNHKAAYALRTFFKFAPETQYVFRDSTNMDWDSLIVSHLNRNIPMYYAGWSVPNINGHAFVCDGYQDEHFFHFNWGWSGSYDGYFYTYALNPGGSNFNLAQELIINAIPDSINYTYPAGCAGFSELNTTSGTIGDGSGPLYGYLPGTDCSWLIAPEDSITSITLHFMQFDVAEGDTLFVFQGSSTASPLIGSYSGVQLPDDLVVESEQAFIEFQTQSVSGASGWQMGFEAQIPVYCTANQMLTDISGTLSDGSGPRNYHNASTCMWMIAPPGVQLIELQFDTFDTEANFDVVTIYDGNEVIGEFSGNEIPPKLSATSGILFVVFTSNMEITAPGWTATYTTDLVGLGEIRSDELTLSAFPNPAHDKLIVHQSNAEILTHIKITNSIGKVVYTEDSQNEEIQVNISGWLPGVYFVEARSGKSNGITKVIIW